jgi:hypothetical protein
MGYSFGSDGDGDYLAISRVKLDEARAGVGWRLPVERSELCVRSRVTWSRPSSAEEDRYSLDTFGRIGPLRSTVEVADPSWRWLTLRGGVALGTELLPDRRANVELFGRQIRLSDGARSQRTAQAGLVGATSVVLAKRIQLRVALSWVGWDDVDGSDNTYDWATAGVGVLV